MDKHDRALAAAIFRGRLNDAEQSDTTPVEMPLGFTVPTPLNELIASMVREQVASQGNQQPETWEEANDFETDDEELLDMSPYTVVDVPDEEVAEPGAPVVAPPEEPPAALPEAAPPDEAPAPAVSPPTT